MPDSKPMPHPDSPASPVPFGDLGRVYLRHRTEIDAALAEVFQQDELKNRLLEAFFIPDYRPLAEASAHLKEKRDAYAEIIGNLTAQ